MFRKQLKLSAELPCCKLCCIKDRCTKKSFVDAFRCQREYEDLIYCFRSSSNLYLARSKIIDLITQDDVIYQTESDLRTFKRKP